MKTGSRHATVVTTTTTTAGAAAGPAKQKQRSRAQGRTRAPGRRSPSYGTVPDCPDSAPTMRQVRAHALSTTDLAQGLAGAAPLQVRSAFTCSAPRSARKGTPVSTWALPNLRRGPAVCGHSVSCLLIVMPISGGQDEPWKSAVRIAANADSHLRARAAHLTAEEQRCVTARRNAIRAG